MIPKVVHYCWFGKNKKPEIVEQCIKTWKIHLPNYKFIEWNEDNIVLDCSFALKAYTKKKWAFVSDYVRLAVLYKLGGIYLDTDMFLVKPVDNLLQQSCFIGRQHDEQLNGCLIGCVSGHPFIEYCIKEYKQTAFDEYRLMSMAIPLILTRSYNIYIESNNNNDVTIYPSDFFYPYPYEESIKEKDFSKYIKPDSYAVHLWNTSWFSKKEIAGFSFQQKNYVKAFVLMMYYVVQKPFYLLRFPRRIFQLLTKWRN